MRFSTVSRQRRTTRGRRLVNRHSESVSSSDEHTGGCVHLLRMLLVLWCAVGSVFSVGSSHQTVAQTTAVPSLQDIDSSIIQSRSKIQSGHVVIHRTIRDNLAQPDRGSTQPPGETFVCYFSGSSVRTDCRMLHTTAPRLSTAPRLYAGSQVSVLPAATADPLWITEIYSQHDGVWYLWMTPEDPSIPPQYSLKIGDIGALLAANDLRSQRWRREFSQLLDPRRTGLVLGTSLWNGLRVNEYELFTSLKRDNVTIQADPFEGVSGLAGFVYMHLLPWPSRYVSHVGHTRVGLGRSPN